jgi:3-hydroxyisobutyrate dehydrogenase-like beta-hydroxyacid dehydrogenase
MPSKRIAWIGLGLIGLPMAARLAAAGWQVLGFDINAQRLALASTKGISGAASVSEAVEGTKLVFTSLPTETALAELSRSLAGALPPDAILVETSTVGPVASSKVADALRARGIAYLRAPISGSVNLAESGALTTFVSGPKASFLAAKEALAAYSRAQIWLGEAEEARYAKLAVNLMVAVTAGMMSETLALARKGGISWQAILDLLGESVVASPLVKYKIDPLRRRDFTPTATGALLTKDLDLIVEAARQAGVPVPLASHMQAVYRAMDAALAAEDFFSVVKLTERAAGLGEPPSKEG